MADRIELIPHTPSRPQFELPDHAMLSNEQIAAVAEFVRQVGGVENAREAIAALAKLKEAA